MSIAQKELKKKNNTVEVLLGNNTSILLIILIAVILVGVFALPSFRNYDNIMNVLRTSPIVGIVAFGATFVLLVGEIDLSVGSILSLSLTIGGLCLAYNEILALVIICVIGFGLGILNGVIVAKAKVTSLMVTLGAMSVYAGIAAILVKGQAIYLYEAPIFQWLCKGTILGLPFPLILFAVISIIGAVFLHKTQFGRNLYYVGANPKAAAYSGIDVDKVKIIAYAIGGMMAAAAGPILASQTNRITPIIGQGYELSAISVAVLGGTILDGGKGNLLGTFMGAIVFGLLLNILALSGMGTYTELLLRGVLLVCIVAVFEWLGRKRGIN